MTTPAAAGNPAGDAGALLAEAFAAGATARLEAGRVLVRGAPPELLARMREARAAIAWALARCRHCGHEVDMTTPGAGLVCGDGRPAHLACHAADAIRRASNAISPAALADPAELTVRGETS